MRESERERVRERERERKRERDRERERERERVVRCGNKPPKYSNGILCAANGHLDEIRKCNHSVRYPY